VATLAAVILFFRSKVKETLVGIWRLVTASFNGWAAFLNQKEIDDGANMALCVLVGTLPTGVLGILLSDVAEHISVAPSLLGVTFLSCAGLLFASRWWKGGDRPLTLKTALIIGFFQGIAVLPGLSRSGTTIAVALALGLKREEAATFSFLLSLPAILGAAALEIDVTKLLVDGPLAAYLLGAASAFTVGLVALYSLVVLVKKGRLWLFAPYVALAGLYALFLA